MFRYNDQKDPMKFNTDTGLKLLLASLLCSLAGIFWQPVFLGAAGVIRQARAIMRGFAEFRCFSP